MNDTCNYIQQPHVNYVLLMDNACAVFDRLALNWAVFTFLSNLHAHFLQLNRLLLPAELLRDSVWTSNVSCYQRRETTGSSSCWPHVRITVTSTFARLKTLLVWLEMRQEYGFCVNIRTEPTGASGEHENTQTRLLIYCPITRQITATGDVERSLFIETGKQKKNRVFCSPALFTDRL